MVEPWENVEGIKLKRANVPPKIPKSTIKDWLDYWHEFDEKGNIEPTYKRMLYNARTAILWHDLVFQMSDEDRQKDPYFVSLAEKSFGRILLQNPKTPFLFCPPNKWTFEDEILDFGEGEFCEIILEEKIDYKNLALVTGNFAPLKIPEWLADAGQNIIDTLVEEFEVPICRYYQYHPDITRWTLKNYTNFVTFLTLPPIMIAVLPPYLIGYLERNLQAYCSKLMTARA